MIWQNWSRHLLELKYEKSIRMKKEKDRSNVEEKVLKNLEFS